ncbi:phage tail protein [Orbus sasakiae]|uniref:Phage tail protein n=1 Tax=Orbus sasakiae TaxID=1078475 RepID=A0ABP9N0S4_9GAMM
MEQFHWHVMPNMSERAQPRVKTVKFGDGYEQRHQDGINSDLRTYEVTLKVPRDESHYIDDFLAKHKGIKAFLWREPNRHRLITVKCSVWSSTIENTVTTISASFEEVIA